MKFPNIFNKRVENSDVDCRTMHLKPSVTLNREELMAVLSLMSTISECNTLKSKQEIQAAFLMIECLGLPQHNDYQKNWDTLKALYYVLKNTDKSSIVLDAGGGTHSPVLNALSSLGYLNLYACDIVDVNYTPERFSDNIKFSIQNVENTNYPDRFFHAITCLSVIEHGVDHRKFFAEMSRIMNDGGLLIITADYWPDYVDCTGIYPYGPNNPVMKVYQASDMRALIMTAQEYGFDLCSPLSLSVDEKAVRWDDVDREYTFIFIAMIKKALNP